MRRALKVLVWTLAIFGGYVIVSDIAHAVRFNHAVQCVKDEDDDMIWGYGFSVQHNTAGLTEGHGVYGGHYG